MEKERPIYYRVTAQLLLAVLIVFILFIAADVIIPILLATFIALLLLPLCQKLEGKKIPRLPAILIVMFFFSSVLGGIATLFIIQATDFASDIPILIKKSIVVYHQFEHYISEKFGLRPVEMTEYTKNSASKIAGQFGAIFSNTLFAAGDILITAVLVPIYSFFFLYYRKSFKKFFFIITPENHSKTVRRVISKIEKLVQNYIVGLSLVVLIVGSLNTFGLFLLDLQYAFFLGFLGGMLTIIPYVGPFIGAMIAVLIAVATKDSGWYVLGVMMVFGIVHMLESNLITPNIVGNKVQINPLAAMMALLIGEILWGIPGMILGIPIMAIIKVIFDHTNGLKPFGFLLGSEFTENTYEPYDEELDAFE